MKKFIILCILLLGLSVQANEITEDYFDIATDYCVYGKYNNAMEYINKILQIEPKNTEAINLKNTILQITNKNSKSYLNSTEKSLSDAYNYKKIGNKTKEIAILQSNSSNYWSNYILAELYRQNKNFKDAQTYYQKAITLKPNHSQSYLGLAQNYISQKNYQKALETLDKYLSYNSNSDIAFALKAECYLNLNLLNEAQTNIDKALKIDSNLTYMLLEAKILYQKGSIAQAKDKFTILSRNVQTSEVYKYIGLCDYAQSNLPDALLNIDKAIILSDDDKTLNSKYNEIKAKLDEKRNEQKKN